jgi:hypothetical protein
MTREEYKSRLLIKEFTLLKTQIGYPSRGEEDVYRRSGYTCNFYVTHFSKDDKNKYGLVTGKTNGKKLERAYPPNSEDSYAPEKGLYVWTDGAFVELIEKLPNQ